MRSRKLGFVTTIVGLLILAQLTGCEAGQSNRPFSTESASTSCQAPGTSAKVEGALCRGNAAELEEALFQDPSSPFEENHQELLAALRRIWNADESYGKGLPWDALKSTRIRAIVAGQLAQGIRNREIEGTLESLRKFAVDFTYRAQTDSEQLDGLRLLGLTDADSQISMLRSVALSSEATPSRRGYAIDALSQICAPEAEGALREISRTLPPKSAEQQRLATALSTRETLSRTWCQRAEKLPAPAVSMGSQ